MHVLNRFLFAAASVVLHNADMAETLRDEIRFLFAAASVVLHNESPCRGANTNSGFYSQQRVSCCTTLITRGKWDVVLIVFLFAAASVVLHNMFIAEQDGQPVGVSIRSSECRAAQLG